MQFDRYQIGSVASLIGGFIFSFLTGVAVLCSDTMWNPVMWFTLAVLCLASTCLCISKLLGKAHAEYERCPTAEEG